MAGNPVPSAAFRWIGGSNKDQTISGTQLYPEIYQSTYTFNDIPASYCGRSLTTRAVSSQGRSPLITTKVTVLRKYNVMRFL